MIHDLKVFIQERVITHILDSFKDTTKLLVGNFVVVLCGKTFLFYFGV